MPHYAQVKLRNDMPDDMLRDAIETSRRVIGSVDDFDTHGDDCRLSNVSMLVSVLQLFSILLLRIALRRDN